MSSRCLMYDKSGFSAADCDYTIGLYLSLSALHNGQNSFPERQFVKPVTKQLTI